MYHHKGLLPDCLSPISTTGAIRVRHVSRRHTNAPSSVAHLQRLTTHRPMPPLSSLTNRTRLPSHGVREPQKGLQTVVRRAQHRDREALRDHATHSLLVRPLEGLRREGADQGHFESHRKA